MIKDCPSEANYYLLLCIKIDDEMRENLHSSFLRCQNYFEGMDPNCEEEIVSISWNIMRKLIKKKGLCYNDNESTRLKLFVQSFIKLQLNNYEGNDNCFKD